MRTIDLATWKRRRHFELYRNAADPFWSVTVDVDVTRLVAACAAPDGGSFALRALWTMMAAVNHTEEMRMRIRGEDVAILDRIHVTSTVLRPDDTFAFGYFETVADRREFEAAGRERIHELRDGGPDLRLRPDRDDLVYHSSLPWLTFTSFSHARLGTADSIPRLVFGRHREVAGRRLMPLSVQVHHGLVDGLHVGRFVERFQELLDELPDRVDPIG